MTHEIGLPNISMTRMLRKTAEHQQLVKIGDEPTTTVHPSAVINTSTQDKLREWQVGLRSSDAIMLLYPSPPERTNLKKPSPALKKWMDETELFGPLRDKGH